MSSMVPPAGKGNDGNDSDDTSVGTGSDGDCPSDVYDCFEREDLVYEFAYDAAVEERNERFDNQEDEDDYYQIDYEDDVRAYDVIRATHRIRTMPRRRTELAVNLGRPYPSSAAAAAEGGGRDDLGAEAAGDGSARPAAAAAAAAAHDDLRNYENRFPAMFRGLVDALHGQQHLRALCFGRGHLATSGDDAAANDDDDDFGNIGPRPNDADLLRLFGTVLPHHKSIRIVRFTECCLGTECVRILTTSLPSNSFQVPRSLTFHYTPLDAEACQLIRRMLQRHVRVHTLRLLECDLDNDDWQAVCEGAETNPHLRNLSLHEGDSAVFPGALCLAVGPHSRVDNLSVGAAAWTDEAFVELMNALCINDSVMDLTLYNARHFRDGHIEWFQHLLTFHNLTLSTIALWPYDVTHENDIFQLLGRSGRVSEVHRRLRKDLHYKIPTRALWPHMIGRLGCFVTPIYRFLRIGNVESLADHFLSSPPPPTPLLLSSPPPPPPLLDDSSDAFDFEYAGSSVEPWW